MSNTLTCTVYCIYKYDWKYYCSGVVKMPENFEDTLHGNVYFFEAFSSMVLHDLDSTAALVLPSGSVSLPPFTHTLLLT